MKRAILLLLAGLLVLAACETEPDEPEEPADEVEDVDDEEYSIEDQPGDAAVSFVTPQDGDTVQSPVQMEFEVEGFELTEVGAPAAGEGHLHVFVDHGCVGDGDFVPGPSEEDEEAGIFHLSDGQSETEIEMEPGERELCVQIGDGVHQTFGDTDEITVTVE